MSRKQKKKLIQILVSAVLFAAVSVCEKLIPALCDKWYYMLILYLVPYFIIGYRVLYTAGRNIIHGQIFDENFLMALATVGAFGTGEYPEAVAVMLFYQIGELFESIAVGRSRKSISALMDIRPDSANVERAGEVMSVSPEEVEIGEIIVIKPGEKVPLDGIVEQGSSSLNTVALTGESTPREVSENDGVISGCVNINGLLRVRVTSRYAESTVSKILELVENSSVNKAKTENFITRFAKYYTPVVVICAVILAVVPSLIIGAGEWSVWKEWISRAMTFLVISCPCALVISVPLTFFGGIGGAGKSGILVKGSNYLELLAKVKTVVFDKTGTLTKGNFSVSALHPDGMEPDELLELACFAELYSDHPISAALKSAYKKPVESARVNNICEYAGYGISAVIDGRKVCVGNGKYMKTLDVEYKDCHNPGTIVHVSVDGVYAGHIVISDEIKADSKEAVSYLQSCGIKTVMLTGDRRSAAGYVAGELGIDEYYAELLPADKVDMVETLINENKSEGALAFVGDGINDAPVLSRADIGIAMGGLGSDAAIEAADIVLMDDSPSKIKTAMRISAGTKRIVLENIIFALVVKFIILIFGALGIADMWWAVFADVGVSVIAILNATRALRLK